MAGFETLRFAVRESIARITLARPASGNAINLDMRQELRTAIRLVAEDAEIRAAIIEGEGRNFCTGGDIASMKQAAPSDGAEGRERLRSYIDLVEQLILLEKPVVAAVQGHAAGAGCGLALAADFVIASTDATFTFSFARVGLVPDFGTFYTLPRLVGMQKARQLIYSARPVAAAQALQIGMIFDVAEPDRLTEAATTLAASLCSGSPAAFGLAKQALARSFDVDLRTLLEFEASAQGICFTTEWHRSAIQAFLARKPSPFTGFAAPIAEAN